MYGEGFAGKKGYISTFERGLQAIYTPGFVFFFSRSQTLFKKENLQETLL